MPSRPGGSIVVPAWLRRRSERRSPETSPPTARRHSATTCSRGGGIQLQGSEVKSLRAGAVQLKDAYAEIRDGEVWLQNMHIPYKPASSENHDPERPRKLLMHRREIERLIGKTAERRG